MSRLDLWRLYMRDCNSPDSYINMSFYFMISAALQRRVWIGNEEFPLFPTMYIVLTGEPGIGKTQAIKPIIECLRYHKMSNKNTSVEMLKKFEEASGNKVMDPDTISSLMGTFSEMESRTYKSTDDMKQDPLLIPVGPDAVTFEQLIRIHIQSTRRKNTGKSTKMSPNGIYTHSSLCIALEEISSLFPPKCEKVVNYLTRAFDCGDYEYQTKHQGIDFIKKSCLNLIGGTTPKFMEASFTDRIIGEGFSARTIFVFEHSARSDNFGPPSFDDEQRKAKAEILRHIKNLSELYGEVKYDDDAYEFLKNYFQKEHPKKIGSLNPKLIPYAVRKNIHVPKLAMAIHFADSLEMRLTLQDCELALLHLGALEDRMHMALSFHGQNPLAIMSKRILKILNTLGPLNQYEIWKETEGEIRERDLAESLKYLTTTNQIEENTKDYTNKDGKIVRKYVSLHWKKLHTPDTKITEIPKLPKENEQDGRNNNGREASGNG